MVGWNIKKILLEKKLNSYSKSIGDILTFDAFHCTISQADN